MQDLIDQIYYLIEESLPVQHYSDPAAQALFATFTPEHHENNERLRLFRRLVKLGLHIP